MKRILIIGAGFLQAFVIKKAKELGYYTIAIDKNPEAVGFKYADESASIDIIDEKLCLEYAINRKIDGVMTAATDYGVMTAAYIAEKMELRGLNYEVAKVIKNKYLIRKTLISQNIDCVKQFYEVSSLSQAQLLGEKIIYPVIVKPCDGSGSKAIKRVDNGNDLIEACKEAIAASLIKKALIEDFVEGVEYGADTFVCDGKVHVVGIMAKKMTAPPVYAELGHCYPSGLDCEDKIKTTISNAIKALDINFGAVNMDFLVTRENEVCIIDIGARMGGNLIGSHILPIGTGIDYMACLIKSAVGDEFELENYREEQVVSTRLLALNPGRVEILPDFEYVAKKYNVKIIHHLKINDRINEYHNNLDGCGYIIAQAKSREIAEKNAELARLYIDSNIIRGK